MRVVVQRVVQASVEVDQSRVASIGPGLLVLVGCEVEDTEDEALWLAGKLVQLRVFDDPAGAMNRSVLEVAGDVLLVSQFTLLASTRKGTRPSWHRAAKAEFAQPRFEFFRAEVERLLGRPVATGVFGAAMQVHITNDGPVTLVIDSRQRE